MATETKPERAAAPRESTIGLTKQGLDPSGTVHWNLIAPELMLAAARRNEGEFAEMGPFVARTSPHTGRSPNDKFVVKESSSSNDVDWGKINQPYEVEKYEARLARIEQKLSALAELVSADDPDLAKRLRTAWQLPARSLAFRNAEHQKDLKSGNDTTGSEPRKSGE